jgi:DNA polymerase I-like protein with 3'-5' exonuclease and polymerase domains
MIEDFKKGKDYHSQTAVNMYHHIKREVEEGTLLV